MHQEEKRHTTKSNIVEVNGSLDSLDFSTNVKVLYFCSEVCDGRVCRIVGTEDVDGFSDTVRLINIVD